MNPFEFFRRNCGRNAGMFVFALSAFFGLFMLAVLIGAFHLQPYLLEALPGAGLFALVWAGVALQRARRRKRERTGYSALSRDELSKARSKLLNNQNRRSL
jgi:threonine/homoserine/homoserine lactone efflux protein